MLKRKRSKIKLKSKVKNPVDAFPNCPSCLSPHVSKVTDKHVYCDYCGWDSVKAYALISAEVESPEVFKYYPYYKTPEVHSKKVGFVGGNLA